MRVLAALLPALALADESSPGWNDCKKEQCDLRVIRHPLRSGCNSTDHADPRRRHVVEFASLNAAMRLAIWKVPQKARSNHHTVPPPHLLQRTVISS